MEARLAELLTRGCERLCNCLWARKIPFARINAVESHENCVQPCGGK